MTLAPRRVVVVGQALGVAAAATRPAPRSSQLARAVIAVSDKVPLVKNHSNTATRKQKSASVGDGPNRPTKKQRVATRIEADDQQAHPAKEPAPMSMAMKTEMITSNAVASPVAATHSMAIKTEDLTTESVDACSPPRSEAQRIIKHEDRATAAVAAPSTTMLRHALVRVLRYLSDRFDVGRDAERFALLRYLTADECSQGLFVAGPSPLTTQPLVRALLARIVSDYPARYDVHHINCDFYGSCSDLYTAIRSRLWGNCKLPPWRRLHELLHHDELIPSMHSTATTVLVLENIDAQIRSMDCKQATLERLLVFLNALVRLRGLRLIVIGHEGKTIRRFSTQFGGFDSGDLDKYILQIPRYTYASLSAHIEAIMGEAIRSMSPSLELTDLVAPKAVQLAAQKALKHDHCELAPVVTIVRRAVLKLQREVGDQSVSIKSKQLLRVRYEHVTSVAAEFFEHDYVHRIRCVGIIPQTVLLVLIDSGPCTEEQLLARVWDRRHVHSWVMVIAVFREEMFQPALELLLTVPVVQKRERTVLVRGRSTTEAEYVALPTREHLLQAAGDKERIQLIIK